MKQILLILLFPVMFSLPSNQLKPDFRDDYIGRYNGFLIHKGLNNNNIVKIDTTIAVIVIEKNLNSDSTLYIKDFFFNEEVKIDSNMNFGTIKSKKRFFGKFYSQDSLIYKYLPGLSPNTLIFKGKKQ